MMRFSSLVLLFGLLAGCFGGGGAVPQDQYYHLAEIPENVPQVKHPLGVIAVSTLQGDALHHERMILYSLQSTPLMLNTYYYHQWGNVPGQMIQEYLISYLRRAGFARTVVRYGERTQIDGQINGYIQRFERIIGNGNPQVKVRLELSFLPRTAGVRDSLTRVYEAEQKATDSSMEATVMAFSQALQTIFQHFVADLAH